jgi:hypothetical protein
MPPLAAHYIAHPSDKEDLSEEGDSSNNMPAPATLHLTVHSSDDSPDEDYANLSALE